MQDNTDKPAKFSTRPRLARTRFVGLDPAQQTSNTSPTTGDLAAGRTNDRTGRPTKSTKKLPVLAAKKSVRSPSSSLSGDWSAATSEISDQSTAHLMQLSGMMRAVSKPGTKPLQIREEDEEDGYWPLGIQQTGPLLILNLYGREPFGRTLPTAVPVVLPQSGQQVRPVWKKILGSPIFKVSLGCLIGLGLLFLVSLFVNLPEILQILGAHLSTPQGIAQALLAGTVYLTGHSLRGLRWKLFLDPVYQVKALKIIKLYQVAIFLNFLLPIRAGEVAKSLALKRIANIPISKSLPTVAMDKSLDLMPALVIIALVPLLGVHMDLQLWLTLGLAGGILLGLLIFIALAAWKRTLAINLLQKMLGLLPRGVSHKIESFAIGFIDALLAGASRPKIFLPAVLLTCAAVACDGLFAMLAFWTIGYPISFGTALFGYTIYNMFYILPTPPGQIGSNEAVGLLVFGGLLHLPGNQVVSMSVFSHLWTALLMTAVGLTCLTTLGLTITSAIRTKGKRESAVPPATA